MVVIIEQNEFLGYSLTHCKHLNQRYFMYMFNAKIWSNNEEVATYKKGGIMAF